LPAPEGLLHTQQESAGLLMFKRPAKAAQAAKSTAIATIPTINKRATPAMIRPPSAYCSLPVVANNLVDKIGHKNCLKKA
jgi:hypothetical protein